MGHLSIQKQHKCHTFTFSCILVSQNGNPYRKNKQTNKCKKVCKQQQEGTENNDVHVSDLQMSNLHKALELDSTTGNRDLKIRRRRPQRERGFITKTTTLHVHHAFLYISLPSLHDYDVKIPNFTLYRGRAQATTKFPPSF